MQARTEMVRWVRVNEINTIKMHLRVSFSSLKKKEKSSSEITARRLYNFKHKNPKEHFPSRANLICGYMFMYLMLTISLECAVNR